MKYSEAELKERRKHRGSTLSILDRKKFESEFDVKSLNLCEEYLQIYNLNPHIRQVFANSREFHHMNRRLGLEDIILDYKGIKSGRTR